MKPHKIGWLNVPGYIPQTWNPIVGCSKVSEGCRNCYAEKMAYRLWCMDSPGYCHTIDRTGSFGWNGTTHLMRFVLEKPLGYKKPRAIFVNSMGDLFHENTPDEWIDRVFAVMALYPQHLFIILTKRPERLEKYVTANNKEIGLEALSLCCEHYPKPLGDGVIIQPDGQLKQWPLPNVWIGVTAENQAAADERIPHLLNTPAAVRFVSCEPLIDKVELDDDWIQRTCTKCGSADFGPCKNDGPQCWGYSIEEEGELCGCRTSTGLDWIIAGGESGSRARTMQYQWAERLRDQSLTAGVPFFFKHWGANPPTEYHRAQDKDMMLEGRRYHQWPAVAKAMADKPEVKK